MRALKDIPSWIYKLLIVVATMIWGLSFVVMKDVVSVMPPAWLLGVRFLTAGILLGIILRKRIHRCLLGNAGKMVAMGAALAVFDFSAFLAQTVGLQHTTPGINAFLTAAYCIIVPFVWWVVGGFRPNRFNIIAAAMAICGIWFVSVSSSGEGLSMGFGEGMTLLSALLFALHIVFVSRFSRGADILVLTQLQFLFEGLYGLAVGALFEPAFSVAWLTHDVIWQMAYLVILSTVVCFVIQNVALAYVPPAQASLLLSLESVFGVLFSILLYGEVLTGRLVFGFALIFVAILVSELMPGRFGKKQVEADADLVT